MNSSIDLSEQVAACALSVGFSSCAILPVGSVDATHQGHYTRYIAQGRHADMSYLARNEQVRFHPSLLFDGAASMVLLTVNYTPVELQPVGLPGIARFAYGRNYHKTVKKMLHRLLLQIQALVPSVHGRAFVDSAPFLERYWAEKGGLGFIGRNRQFIDPRRGSYFFLCELILDVELLPFTSEKKKRSACGSCDRCLRACPSGALTAAGLDSRRCLSYLTVESGSQLAEPLHGQLFGCDCCQTACPYNRFAIPTTIPDFAPREFLTYSVSRWRALGEQGAAVQLAGSALMRAGYAKLLENLDALESL